MRCQAATLVTATLLLTAQPAFAQRPPERGAEADTGESLFSESNQLKMYERSKLSYGKATLYSLALPGLGNYYAKDYFLGTTILTFLGFSALFIGYGLYTDQSAFMLIGAVAAGTTYATAIGTSIWAVRGYNNELQRSLKVSRALSWSFHF